MKKRARTWEQEVNRRVLGRHILRQSRDEACIPYRNKLIRGGGGGSLVAMRARKTYGMTLELTTGYQESYGTVLQTDVVCAACRAFFIVHKPAE